MISSWKDVQKNIGKFQNLFRQNFIIVDNNDPNLKYIPLHLQITIIIKLYSIILVVTYIKYSFLIVVINPKQKMFCLDIMI